MTRGGNLIAGAPNLRIAGGEWLGIDEFVGPRGPEKPVLFIVPAPAASESLSDRDRPWTGDRRRRACELFHKPGVGALGEAAGLPLEIDQGR